MKDIKKCVCGRSFKRLQDLKGHLNGAIYQNEQHEMFAKKVGYYSPLNPAPYFGKK